MQDINTFEEMKEIIFATINQMEDGELKEHLLASIKMDPLKETFCYSPKDTVGWVITSMPELLKE
jgi:hypothetical protein